MPGEGQNLLLCHCRQQGGKPVRNQACSWRQLFLIWSNWANLWLMCKAWSLTKLQGCFLWCSFGLITVNSNALSGCSLFCVFVLSFAVFRRRWIKIFLQGVTTKFSHFQRWRHIISLDFDLQLWESRCNILEVS